MRVLLMRHGAAEAGQADPPLSEDGRRDVELVLEALELDGGAALLMHSPLRRARETAEQCAARWPIAQQLETEALLPDTPPQSAGEAISEHADLLGPGSLLDTGLIIVAHLPLLPRLSFWLTGETLPFETASAWLLDADSVWMGMATPLRGVHAEDLTGRHQ